MKGKIVLVPFPFTDLTASKLRPALVLYEGEKDVVLSFITSKLFRATETDIILYKDHDGFKTRD